MNRVLRFKSHLRPELLDDERVFLIGEREQSMLRGRVYPLVVPLVDGRRTVGEIIGALAGRALAPEVLFALMRLEERGDLVETKTELPPEASAFWQSQGIDAERALQRLAATPIAVHAIGDEDAGPLAHALRNAGARVQSEASICVVVTRDYLDPALAGWNRRALEQKTQWALVKPSGAVAWVGPVFRPHEGPCWACLAHRLRANRPVETYLERRTGIAGPFTPPRAELPASIQASAHFAALTLARWMADGGAGPVDDHLLTLELSRFAREEHPVVRRPQCSTCGDAEMVAARMRAPVVLESRPKRFTEDGGHRCASPEETLARLERQVSPITGAIASAGPLAGRDHPLRPVHGAAYRVCPAGDAPSFDDFDRTSMGKGKTAAQAHASALSEAIERYSAIFQGDEARVRARFVDLGDEAVHPDALQNYSEAQLRARETHNAGIRDEKRLIPMAFDERAEIDWTPVWSLTHGRRRWVPTAYCYLHAPVPPGERFCYLNPNGHAAGNCLEEAIIQAFFELCERDAVAIWWYNRIRRPSVDLGSFGEPYFLSLAAHYEALGHRLWVLDLTTDLGIPTFVAISRSGDTGRICMGFGCHFEPRLGVQRALTEHNQLFDPTRTQAAPWEDEAIGDGAFLFPSEALPARRATDFSPRQTDDLREDVRACVLAAARAGLETLVLEQTRPDLGLVAVKVMVPGLRHFWPRFGPGRLYDVPVGLGWIEQPLAESQLNPVPLYV